MKAKTFMITLSVPALIFMAFIVLTCWPKREFGFTDSFEKKPILAPIGVKAFPNKGDFYYDISFPGDPSGDFLLVIWGKLDKNKIDNFIKSNDFYSIPDWWDRPDTLPLALIPLEMKGFKLRGNILKIKGTVMKGRADLEIFVQEDNGKFFGKIHLNTRHG